MSTYQLEINDLWFKYRSYSNDDWTIRSLNLSIKSGELVGLLGPSGCGKTTLLRLIAGFETPARGFIKMDGREISNTSKIVPPEKRSIGMVFQDYALFPHLNAWENVCFGLNKGGRSRDTSRVDWLLDLLGLFAFRERYPHELSGGQQQRLAFARALAPDNSLLILDEPFCSLDVEVRSKLRGQLSSVLTTCSATALLVTHDPHEALAICDRVAVMKDGELHQVSTPMDMVEKPATSFVGQFVFQKNILPITKDKGKLFSPLGEIYTEQNDFNQLVKSCIFDTTSLKISVSSSGIYKIISKEFHWDHWIITVDVNGIKIRVWHDLHEHIRINDFCDLYFDSKAKGILFPGSIACNFC